MLWNREPKIPVIMPFLLAMLLITGVSGAYGVLQARSAPEVHGECISYETGLVSVDVRIPVITGCDNSGVEDELNEGWRAKLVGLIDDVTSQAEELFEEYGEEMGHWFPFQAVSDFRVAYLDEGLVSIPILTYSFTGGAHGMTFLESTNIDLITGKLLNLQDLFLPGYDYMEVIRAMVVRQMEADPSPYFAESLTEVTIAPDHSYYLTDQGIVICFGLYEIAPYSSGIQEFLIPFTEVWEGLQPTIQGISAQR